MMSGQSINDRITAARYSIAGQGLAKSVCKATTEEVIGPKKKHLDYLLHCTNEPNVSIPQLANLLIERTNQASWVIVFKALVTVHHLMCYGNERFTQYLASSNCHFQLSGFLDKTGVQGYDMSTFIRRYAKYLNEKALSYRTVAFDFCKVKRGKEEGVLRSMNAEKLVKTVPILQNQLDALLEFDCTANELTNGVINTAFMLLFRDLIRLFACYNDGIINLLEKYFDMNKKMCRDALDIYKKFLIRMDRVAEFLKVAENVGIDKGDIPDLTKAPGSLLDALEQHLAALEGKKGPGGATTPTGRQFSVKKGVLALSSTSNAFGSAAAAQVGFRQGEVNGVGVDESIRKIALEEEQAALNNHKERKFKELGLQSPTSGSANTNPFLSSPTPVAPGEDAVNLFGSPTASVPSGGGKASDDLLCLAGNPFADERAPSSSIAMVQAQHQQHFWGGGGAQNALGVAKPLGAAPGFDAFGDILQPMPTMATASSGNMQTQVPQTGGSKSQSKVITGDLDSSLASLVQNLEINRGAPIVQKGPHVWNSPKNMAKTGGANWTPHVAGSTAGAGPWNSPQHNYQPMGGARPATMGPIQQQNVMAPLFGAPANAGPRPAVQQQRAMDPFGNL